VRVTARVISTRVSMELEYSGENALLPNSRTRHEWFTACAKNAVKSVALLLTGTPDAINTVYLSCGYLPIGYLSLMR
jgi:hypothetical protein